MSGKKFLKNHIRANGRTCPAKGGGGQLHPAVGGTTFGYMIWHTYILQSEKDNKYYIGYTGNLENRLKQHNSGSNLATRHRKPFKLVHSEAFDNKSGALKRERQIKRFKGGEAFKKLFNNSI